MPTSSREDFVNGLLGAGLVGDQRRLGPVVHVQGAEDRVDMQLDGRGLDAERTCDLLVGEAGADEVEHLALPERQVVDRAGKYISRFAPNAPLRR